MQTFLPHDDFVLSMECLDNQRLGKQRVEAKQILNALENNGGWASHPATKMWKGFEPLLKYYHDICILEWMYRGFNNNMELFYSWTSEHDDGPEQSYFEAPPWLGDPAFHTAHQSNLLRKADEALEKIGVLLSINNHSRIPQLEKVVAHYKRISTIYNWTTDHNLPYIWPI